MKNFKKLFAWVLSLAMILGCFQGDFVKVNADTSTDAISIRVIVENYNVEEIDSISSSGESVTTDAPMGTFVDVTLEADENDSVLTLLKEALDSNNIEYSVTSGVGYVTEINGIEDCWMFSVNDYFGVDYAADVTVADGDLVDGDVIRFCATYDYGDDIGCSYSDKSTSLSELSFSDGTLNEEFASNVRNYTLYIDKYTEDITPSFTSSNKFYQVRTYLNEVNVEDKGIHPYQPITVKDGDVLYFVDGDPSWPSMLDNSQTSTIYSVKIKKQIADSNEVKIIIENNNLTTQTSYVDGEKVEEEVPTGTFVETSVLAGAEDTGLTLLQQVLDKNNISYTIGDYNYISEINGIENAWMFSVNDFYGMSTLDQYSFADGTLQNEDVIRFSTTANWGPDLGGYWDNTDTTLKELSISGGTLNKDFASDDTEYTLYIDSYEAKVTPSFTASNKNYQVRTYLNEVNVEEKGIHPYKSISVKDGDVLYFVDGDKSWPSMNGNSQESTTYTVNVKKISEDEKKVRIIVENQNLSSQVEVVDGENVEKKVEVGTFVDEYVVAGAEDNGLTLLQQVLDKNEISYTIGEHNYVSEINGITNAWMFSVNDFYGVDTINNYSVSNGTLENEDVIRFSTTVDWGPDLGGYWDNTDTTLKELSFDKGTLDSEFSSSDTSYVLYIDSYETEVTPSFTASNKNYQVRTYLNDANVSEKGIHPYQPIKVKDGDVLYFVDGDKIWPSMNGNSQEPTTYSVEIKKSTDSDEQVRIIVENQNITSQIKTVDGEEVNTPVETGTFVDEYVTVGSDDTGLSLLQQALDENEITYTVNEYNYVCEINDINDVWMFSVNDYYGTKGISDYKLSDDSLEDGDVIRFSTTANWGPDLGSYWDNTDTTLKELSFSKGELDTDFSPEVTENTLYIDEDSTTLYVDYSAANKNYQVRMYLNEMDVNSKGLHPYKSVTVTDGDVLYIVDGDKTWPSMNGTKQKPTIYKINIKKINPTVEYRVHVQTNGWEKDYRTNGETSGTVGKSLRLEGIQLRVAGLPSKNNGIEYRTHVQKNGWETEYKSNNEVSGTVGKAKRLEAIQIRLTGDIADKYDVYYRVQAEKFGWLGWAKNDEKSGTAGYGFRLEAIQVVLSEKDAQGNSEVPGNIDGVKVVDTVKSFYDKKALPKVTYRTQVQTYGWQAYVSDGKTSGTVGKAKRLEAIQIKLENNTGIEGGITYQTHVQKIGWQAYVSNGALSGTVGKAYRLESIRIKLTGDLANYYDVMYRVQVQKTGWQKFVKSGSDAGTTGQGLRLEAIQIVLTNKGFKY